MQVHLSKIDYKNRARTKFGNMKALQDDITRHGLIHPIVLTPNTDKDSSYEYKLVAGGRRLQAHLNLGIMFIEAIERDEMSETERKELELSENLYRENFTWVEQVKLVKEIHSLKIRQAEEEDTKWTLADTATLLNKSSGSISEDLKLAELTQDTEILAKVITLPKKTALARATTIQKAIEYQEESPKLDRPFRIKNQDCLTFLNTLDDNSIDLVITDPPYGIEQIADVQHTYAKGLLDEEDKRNADTSYVLELLTKVAEKLYAVMVENAHGYIFIAPELYKEIKTILEKHFYVHAVPLIWNKTVSTTPFRGNNYQQCYEMLLFFVKGERTRQLELPSLTILDYKPTNPKDKKHVFHKPNALLTFLIKQSSRAGQTVLDPFMGSGSTVVNAVKNNRRGYGCELDKDVYAESSMYINQELKDFC